MVLMWWPMSARRRSGEAIRGFGSLVLRSVTKSCRGSCQSLNVSLDIGLRSSFTKNCGGFLFEGRNKGVRAGHGVGGAVEFEAQWSRGRAN